MKWMLNKLTALLVIGLTVFVTVSSQAQDSRIYIDVGQATIKKSLLAIPPFQFYGSASDKTAVNAGQELFSVVYNDLSVSSLFTFIKQEAFLEDTSKTGLKPKGSETNGFDFQSWNTIGTEFLIRGGYRLVSGKISFEVYLYYVPQARLVFGKIYEGSPRDIRRIAHTFANDVVKNLTGKSSIFNTKLVVSSTRDNGKFKEIWVMDWDGANARKVSNHRSIAISPTWSPDAKKIAYTAFAYHSKAKVRNTDLFVYELDTNKRWLVSYRKGINSGAAFFPDGKHLLLTLSQADNPDIYKMTADGASLTRLTNGPNRAMNVEPAISADGKKVAFSSDRSGKPMIYTMNIDGTGVKRITFAGKYNASPAWSPDGKKIAFAGYDKTHFDIFVINADGTGLQRIAQGTKPNGKPADNEDPTFSPDGRHILFVSNRTGKNQLYIVNVDGTNERRITFDRFEYFRPKWSPFLNN